MSIVGSTVRDSPVVTIIGVDDGSLDGDGGVSAQYDKLEGKQAVTARLITWNISGLCTAHGKLEEANKIWIS